MLDCKSLVTCVFASVLIVNTRPLFSNEPVVSGDAKPWPELSDDALKVLVQDKAIFLTLKPKALQERKAVIPRLSAPIRSIRWVKDPDTAIKFWPEQEEWLFSWKEQPKGDATIEVVFDRSPVLPADCPEAEPAGDDSIMLHAYQATTFGEKLRFEPQWYKNTVGYWTVATDYATWKLRVNEPGTYSVAVLQGCGKGQGGSDAVISLRRENKVHTELDFQTVDTGHFQNFRWNHLGLIDIDQNGSFELRINAKRIAHNALFDVRAIHLVKQADASK